MDWSVAIRAFVSILERPTSEKGYRELRDYYRNCNMLHEAESLDYLIQEKFHGSEDTLINKK